MNKRGSFDDVVFITILVFVLGITTLIGWVFLSKVNTAIQGQSDFSTAGKAILTKNTNQFVSTFDGIFIVIVVFLAIATLFFASQIDASPIMFPLTIIVAIILVVVSAVFGNSYYALASEPEMSTYADDFVIIPYFFNHIVQFILVFVFLVAGIMYAKTQMG